MFFMNYTRHVYNIETINWIVKAKNRVFPWFKLVHLFLSEYSYRKGYIFHCNRYIYR